MAMEYGTYDPQLLCQSLAFSSNRTFTRATSDNPDTAILLTPLPLQDAIELRFPALRDWLMRLILPASKLTLYLLSTASTDNAVLMFNGRGFNDIVSYSSHVMSSCIPKQQSIHRNTTLLQLQEG